MINMNPVVLIIALVQGDVLLVNRQDTVEAVRIAFASLRVACPNREELSDLEHKVELNISWKDGFGALENSRASVAVVTNKVAPSVAHGNGQTGVTRESQGAPAGGDSQFSNFMGKIMSVARSQGIGVQTDASGGLKTDTAVAGPWDRGELHSGLGFMVVTNDVMLSLDLRGITYEQANALLAKAAPRIVAN